MIDGPSEPQGGHHARTASLALLDKLARGWSALSTLPREFVEAWEALFNTSVDQSTILIENNLLLFTTELDAIKLRGMDEILCCCVGTTLSVPLEPAQQIWKQPKSLGRSIFLIAFSSEAMASFQGVPKDRCLKLGPQEVGALLSVGDPFSALKRLLRFQFSLRRLSPFDIGHPPASHVFYGRKRQLNELIQNDSTSYAIVGPLGIGKTTLLRQYRGILTKQKDPRLARATYVNFAYCQETDENRVARFLAMQIAPTARNDTVTVSSLYQFMRRLAHVWGGPPELILDEVNDFCFGQTFQVLGNLMREGHCRLLLGGRGQLYRALAQGTERGPSTVTSSNETGSAIERRQVPMRLEALDVDAARDLLATPLADLGFSVDRNVIDDILAFTGRIPHLIQYCAVQLVNEVAESPVRNIGVKHFDAVRFSFDAGQFFTDPLRNFETAEAKYLALVCLSKLSPTDSLSVKDFQGLAQAVGLNKTIDQIKALGDDLVINNVLMWNGGRYALATGALSYYARDWGYLDTLLAETKLFLGLSRDTS